MHSLFRAGQEFGWLQPRVSKLYPLSEAAASHQDVVHNQGTLGKLVLDALN